MTRKKHTHTFMMMEGETLTLLDDDDNEVLIIKIAKVSFLGDVTLEVTDFKPVPPMNEKEINSLFKGGNT